MATTFRNNGDGSSGGGGGAPEPPRPSQAIRTIDNSATMRPTVVLGFEALGMGHHDAGWRAGKPSLLERKPFRQPEETSAAALREAAIFTPHCFPCVRRP